MTKKIFPYNEEVDAQFKLAKRLFHASMSGVTADSMKGMRYKVNFGVGLPRIKEIAMRFEYNSLLTQRTWWSNIRELMILSTLILGKEAEKAYSEIPDLHEWTTQLFNIELCEQFSKNFLSLINPIDSNIEQTTLHLIEDNEDRKDFEVALGYINYCNLVIKYPNHTFQTIDRVFETLQKDVYSESYNIYANVARFLRVYTRKDAERVKQIVDNLDENKSRSVQKVIEEVRTELMF